MRTVNGIRMDLSTEARCPQKNCGRLLLKHGSYDGGKVVEVRCERCGETIVLRLADDGKTIIAIEH